ncbi:MAG: ABC transporter ATP-binding protein/permease [Vallitaleaceae bacterium]|nr:ABC transporter ATP-binding protein/permease [Vallitaleaceae bacterium]
MALDSIREDEHSEESLKLATIKRLFGRLVEYKKEVIKVLMLMIFIIGVSVVNPIFIKIAIDTYVVAGDIRGLLMLAGITIVINFLSKIAIKWRIVIMSKVANDVLMKIRQELYTHIQKLSFNFFDKRPAGKILARVVGDVNSLKDVLINGVVTLIPDFLQIMITLVIMFLLNARLAISAIILLPLLIGLMYISEIRAHKKWRIFRKKNSTMNAFIHEDFSGIKVVQSYTAQKKTSEDFEEILEEHKQSFISAIVLNDLFWPIVEISWGAGTALVFYIGVSLSSAGTLEVGTLIAFTAYITMFWNPIMNLSNFYNQLIMNLAGAERIFEIMDMVPDVMDETEAVIIPPIKGHVEFENVTFGYEEETVVLKNVSFKVKAGETIAMVGATGGGKSTIINLMSRFYNIQEGRILIDRLDIAKVNIESLRSQMGIMTQDTFLFSGSIKENIRYGKLDATDEEIIEAAKSVSAHSFIMACENGYDTKLNERGTKLSVGQRQLIAFARTMLSRPKILILDEATSSIDTHTEKLVQKGIEALLEGRTSFVIAHRLSTIKNADRIFVVDNQGILESGSHDQLLQEEGIYYNLYMSQFKAGA